MKRLFYFVLLNIVVTAVTVIGVLVAWQYYYGVNPENVIPINIPIPFFTIGKQPEQVNPTASPPDATKQPFVIYQMERGDTLELLATQFGVTVEQILQINGLPSDHQTSTGEMIKIPLGLSLGEQASVFIDGAIGVGDLASERVIIKKIGGGEQSLHGWVLEDQDGNKFVFPELSLYQDGIINIFSGKGTTSVLEMYWGKTEPVWRSGELVQLKNADGQLISTYHIP